MASTYSNLKIQLMATGENSGTWGTVTNTNLGTAIEEAIVGSADVTFASGDVTLTLTNTNATQTARNLRLNLTGTTGGARNLIVPSIEKVYIVNNGCADAVTVKNSAGAGIAVPAGKTMYVYNTGTAVVDAITHLTSLTVAGTMTAANVAGDGSALTGLNASNISSGTISNARTTAASANGASTIVARDASGNFSANTITANLTGNVTGNLTGTAANATVLQNARTIAIQDGVTGTATSFDGSANISIPVTGINASVINTGTIANARTTASSSNGANTIVSRGASGEFSAGAITADGSGITALNASNVSTGTLAVARGGTGAATLTANNVILGNGTSAVNFVAPGTSGNVLLSNGTTWTSASLASNAFVTGMIMLWSGSIASIPSGWALCNGANGTPDLRDRFVVGAGSTYAVAATGGSANAIVVAHTHTGTTATNGAHSHTYTASEYNCNQNSGQTQAGAAITGTTSTAGAHNHTFTTDSTGSSGTNANLPPYYALAYIMKL